VIILRVNGNLRKTYYMNIDDCCSTTQNEIEQVRIYIRENGTDFETMDESEATSYLKESNPSEGPLYVIKENGTYLFIRPTSGKP
jgi:hypothetical protein